MFWLIIGLVAAAVAVTLVLPLVLRGRRAPADAAAHDRAVYRDQLAEVARDRERGLLDEKAAAAARLEIQRRILRTDREAPAAAPGLDDMASVPANQKSTPRTLNRRDGRASSTPLETTRRGT